jgi:hypothetical protein
MSEKMKHLGRQHATRIRRHLRFASSLSAVAVGVLLAACADSSNSVATGRPGSPTGASSGLAASPASNGSGTSGEATAEGDGDAAGAGSVPTGPNATSSASASTGPLGSSTSPSASTGPTNGTSGSSGQHSAPSAGDGGIEANATSPSAGTTPGSGFSGAVTAGSTTGTDAGGLTYVFSTFWEASGSSLLIYKAPDDLNFTEVSNSGYAGPTDNLRDPSIMKYSDGKYYVAFTTPEGKGCCGADLSFSIAVSPDLMTWTTFTTVPSGVPGTQTTWAPEWFKDTDGSINILVSIDPGGGHRTYVFKATDSTLMTWQGPTEAGIGPDFIDTFVVLLGGTYHAFTKNSATSYIEHATATSLTGPWTFVGTGDWAGWGVHREGPAVIQLPGGVWRAFIDGYGSGGHEMYTDSTDDFATWTTPAPIPVIGNTTSHGTVIGVPQL